MIGTSSIGTLYLTASHTNTLALLNSQLSSTLVTRETGYIGDWNRN